MKKILILIIICITFASCEKDVEIKNKIEYIYFNDTIEKSNTPYDNFKKDIYVDFDVSKDYKEKKYRVIWYLWIDGEIAESNLKTWGELVEPKNLNKYKAKVKRIENERIPNLLKFWKE